MTTPAGIEVTVPGEVIDAPSLADAAALGIGAVLTGVDVRNLRARARWFDDGVYATPMFEHLNDAEYHALAAVREVGHAVVGVVLGMRVAEVAVGPVSAARRGRYVHRGDVPVAPIGPALAHTAWGPGPNVPCGYYNAVLWAGQRAQRRALAARGWLNADTEVDLRVGGWQDAALVLCVADLTGLPEDDGLAAADELVDQHWPVIEQVTAALIAAQRLDGALVHRMVTR